MKTRNLLLGSIILLATLISCNCNNNKKSKENQDYTGEYFGVLPCASCPGIETTIILNNNGSYTKKEKYLESDNEIEVTTGKYTYLPEKSVIQIADYQYLIGENSLIMLNKNGEKITGELAENYVLTKK